MRYVERNPVKAHMNRFAWAYRWSSAAYHIDKVHVDPLLDHEDELLGSPDEWRGLLKDAPSNFEYLQDRFRDGRPCGSDSFVKYAEEVTGRSLFPKKIGRPRKQLDQSASE